VVGGPHFGCGGPDWPGFADLSTEVSDLAKIYVNEPTAGLQRQPRNAALQPNARIREIAGEFNITSNLGCHHLELLAIYGDNPAEHTVSGSRRRPSGPAGAAVAAAQANVAQVADEQYGFVTPEGKAQLDLCAVYQRCFDEHSFMQTNNDDWETIADWLGIQTAPRSSTPTLASN
jgi:hypothetical protein